MSPVQTGPENVLSPLVSHWRRWLLVLGMLLIALSSLGFGRELISDPKHFPITNIEVGGELRELLPAELKRLVKRHLHGNYFSVDMARIRDAVESLPWVQRARVGRAWPNTLKIWVSEQRAVARWGDTALLNADGVRFAAIGHNPAGYLPRLYGPDREAPRLVQVYQRFAALLRSAGMRLDRLTLNAAGEWMLHTAGGAELRLREPHADARLSEFLALLPQLKVERGGLRADLRYEHGFAISHQPGAKAGGKQDA